VPEISVSQYAETQGQSTQGPSTQAYPQFVKNAAPSPSTQGSHSGVKSWLKTAFRRTSKGQSLEKKHIGSPSPFVGGASLAQPDGIPQVTETAVDGNETPEEVPVSKFLTVTDGSRYSDHEEPNAGPSTNPVEETAATRVGEYEESEEARDQFNDADVAMPVFKSQRPLSPARDSRFREVI